MDVAPVGARFWCTPHARAWQRATISEQNRTRRRRNPRKHFLYFHRPETQQVPKGECLKPLSWLGDRARTPQVLSQDARGALQFSCPPGITSQQRLGARSEQSQVSQSQVFLEPGMKISPGQRWRSPTPQKCQLFFTSAQKSYPQIHVSSSGDGARRSWGWPSRDGALPCHGDTRRVTSMAQGASLRREFDGEVTIWAPLGCDRESHSGL